jgi:hypothetical protein
VEQVILAGGAYTHPPTGSVSYNAIQGADTWLGVGGTLDRNLVPLTGTLKELRVRCTVAPGAGKSWNLRLMKNNVVQALQVTIANLDTTGYDGVNTVNIAQGDTVMMRLSPSGLPAATFIQFTLVFETATAGGNMVFGFQPSGPVANPGYMPVMCGMSAPSANESAHKEVIPTDGTLRTLYVKTGGAIPGGMTVTWTLRVNGADTTLTATVPGGGQTANDLVHTVPVVAGDVVTMKVTCTGGTYTGWVFHGLAFIADEDGESIVMNCSYANMNNTQPSYKDACGNQQEVWDIVEANVPQIVPQCHFGKFYIEIGIAPAVGSWWVFVIRINGGHSGVGCNITAGLTKCHDETNLGSASAWDIIDIVSSPQGVGATIGYFGFVINPSGISGGGGGGLALPFAKFMFI